MKCQKFPEKKKKKKIIIRKISAICHLLKLGGHIALGLPIHLSVHPSFSHTFGTSHIFGNMYASF